MLLVDEPEADEAGRKNHQKPGRGRSPSRSAAAPIAMNGWIFWITTGVR